MIVLLKVCYIDTMCKRINSVLLFSYSISSGALGCPDLLLSYSVIALALHITIILIITIP